MKLTNLIFKDFSFNAKKRIKKNLTSKLSQNFLLIFIQIFYPSAMIAIYGLENFGIWLFLIALPSIFSVINFNVNAAAQTEMSICFNKKNNNKLFKIFTNTLFITIFLILLIIFISIILINLNLINFKILSKFSRIEKNLILFFIFSSFILNFFNSIFKCSLNFKGNISLDSYLETVYDALGKIAILISGFFYNSILIASIFLFCSVVLKVITYYILFLVLIKEKLFNYKSVSFLEIKRLFRISIAYYLETFSSLVKENFQLIIIGIFFNAEIIGIVGTLKTLFYFLPMRIWNIFQSILNYEIISFYTKKKYLALKKNFKKFLYFYLFNTSIFFLCVLTIGKYIYNLWIHNSHQIDTITIFLISLDVSVLLLSSNLKFVGKSINKFTRMSVFSLIIFISILIIAYFLFKEDYSYLTIFILNIIESIFTSFFNYFNLIKLFNKIKN